MEDGRWKKRRREESFWNREYVLIPSLVVGRERRCRCRVVLVTGAGAGAVAVAACVRACVRAGGRTESWACRKLGL